jgi:hypothetical protein
MVLWFARVQRTRLVLRSISASDDDVPVVVDVPRVILRINALNEQYGCNGR